MHRSHHRDTVEVRHLLQVQRPRRPYDEALHRRLGVCLAVIWFSLVLLLARTWHLQIVQGEQFLRLAENNRLRDLRTKSLRGKLVDRHGQVLADNRVAYTLMAIPEDLPPREQLIPLLRTMNIETEALNLRSRRSSPGFKPLPIQRNLHRDQVAYFAEHRMDFPGLFIEIEPSRVYPYGTMAAHLLGYLGEIGEAQLQRDKEQGYAAGDIVGQAGLEHAYENMLHGTAGSRHVEVDALGRETQVIATRPPLAGQNLVLTLDTNLQVLAEQLLENHAGSIVAMDPQNGQILALASRPAYDPNVLSSRPTAATWAALSTGNRFPLHNRATQGQYPPGSVFKIVTAMAALAEGVITPTTTVCCSGHYAYGERTFRDWKPEGHGCVQLRLALAVSCDVYFYHVGQMLGVDRIARYANAFGLGQATGFPGREKIGLIPSSQWKRRVRGQPWFPGETLSVAIGQSYTLTTPLQIVNMTATLANGGTLYKPYLVLRQAVEDGSVIQEMSPTALHTLNLKPQHVQALRQGVWSVVNDPRGTGKQARHEHIIIAGKTGTAQVIDVPPHLKSYQQDRLPEHYRHHAWFVAYAPFEDPRIAVVVMIENAGKGGGQFAGFAKTLIEAYLTQHYPTPATPVQTTQVTLAP